MCFYKAQTKISIHKIRELLKDTCYVQKNQQNITHFPCVRIPYTLLIPECNTRVFYYFMLLKLSADGYLLVRLR